jgi:integrase
MAVGDRSFILFKKVSGLSDCTIRDYRRYLTSFFFKYPTALDPKDSRSSVLSYLSGDLAPATYNLRRAYLKTFWNWLVSEGIATRNPVADLPSRKAEPRIVKTDIEDIRKVLYSNPDGYAERTARLRLSCSRSDTCNRPIEPSPYSRPRVESGEKRHLPRAIPPQDSESRSADLRRHDSRHNKLQRVRRRNGGPLRLFCSTA